jgi:hypothetical protein
MDKKICCIITRYNEHVDWLDYIQSYVDSFIIYNKGPNDNIFKDLKPNEELTSKLKIIKLPNVGRIDHTLVYHILENWDCLNEITVSLPASILMCYKKGAYLSAIRNKLSIVKEKYNGFYSPRFHKVYPNFNYSLDDYLPEGKCNRNGNPFVKSEYSDFQEWKKAIIDTRPMRYVGMRGMFAVCKENILHVDKQIYENLLKSLSVGDNIENGHFAERIWAHLFRQYSFDSIKKEPNDSDKPEGYEEELCAIRNLN